MNAVAVNRRAAPVAPRVARPRVTMVVASLDVIGGHGVQATTLAAHLRDEGYAVSLLPIDPAFPRPLQRVKRWPYARTLLTQALYRPSLRRLAECDVVHVFAASYWSFLLGPVPAIQAARRLGKRVVLNYHSGEADDHLARWGRLVHPFLRMADSIIVPSRFLHRVFTRRGHICRVIPNVVDTTAFRYRERVPLRPRLLSTRNLEPGYDVASTLEAFARIHRACPSATLTVVGRGTQEEPLRRLAASLGVDGAVRFAGRVEPALMPALCDEHDIFVNASLVDNQPISILEAMAAGLPVVSTPTGAIAEMLVDGAAGSLVPPRDPAAMAAAVNALLADPDRAAAMARRGRHAVDAYTWPEVRDRWAAAYGAAA
jgi:glycosyltransferase involved in cell wall biosynthesis